MKNPEHAVWRWGIPVFGAALLGLLAGCVLFNQAPVARITASVLSGASPLVVVFDASDSTDADGVLVGFLWSFGDGDTKTGESVAHTFVATTETRRFTVTLTVTDDRGARSETSQTIEVLAGGAQDPTGEGLPVALITTDKLVGLIPLTVAFDAVGSIGGAGNIIEYDWDFGDGDIAIGSRVTHTFEPEETDEFTVTLLVWNSQGAVGTAQVEIVAIVPAGQTGDDEPEASITVSDPNMILESQGRPDIPSLFEVDFDPRGSSADAGHQIEYYVWDFGDGKFLVMDNGLEVTHIYELRSLTHTYVARLTVYDEQGLEGTATVNITLTDAFGVDEEEEN